MMMASGCRRPASARRGGALGSGASARGAQEDDVAEHWGNTAKADNDIAVITKSTKRHCANPLPGTLIF